MTQKKFDANFSGRKERISSSFDIIEIYQYGLTFVNFNYCILRNIVTELAHKNTSEEKTFIKSFKK